MEKWKPVVGWEGFYEVSSRGNIRKKDGTLITQTVARNGYKYFQARRSGQRKCLKTNVIVARAFIGEPAKGVVCDHINRNKLDNRTRNLHYVTRSENMLNSTHWEESENVSFAHSTPRLKKKYRVKFSLEGKQTMFGSYLTKEEAEDVAKEIRVRIVAGDSLVAIKRSRQTLSRT